MDVKRWSIVMVKALAASVLVTAAGIALFSALAYFFRLDDGMINAGVVVLHILSCFAGGFLAGKGIREKKYLWGLLAGVLYFIVLLIISLILAGEEGVSVTNYLTTILICLGSGMLGGMVS
ncbi:putative membrane protein (TIGR04086 family) [Catenibacillus scindens]|uniref:Putative membrane protein (TIGR04086 family) n=1 Tax=Catenibacillus scindens TaxID=673271 RepID=A0A7W8HB44_9FIRM|nr:putative membrane protein (TIGR04086 family) [Catenibacillus scindens]